MRAGSRLVRWGRALLKEMMNQGFRLEGCTVGNNHYRGRVVEKTQELEADRSGLETWLWLPTIKPQASQ